MKPWKQNELLIIVNEYFLIVNMKNMIIEEVEDDEAGYICSFLVSEIRKDSEDYEDLLTMLNDDKFILKKQYHAVRRYMKELAVKQKTEDDNLLDLL